MTWIVENSSFWKLCIRRLVSNKCISSQNRVIISRIFEVSNDAFSFSADCLRIFFKSSLVSCRCCWRVYPKSKYPASKQIHPLGSVLFSYRWNRCRWNHQGIIQIIHSTHRSWNPDLTEKKLQVFTACDERIEIVFSRQAAPICSYKLQIFPGSSVAMVRFL